MAREFNVVPNIRRARITESIGEMILEIEGADDDIEAGIKYLVDHRVDVEPVVGDVLE